MEPDSMLRIDAPLMDWVASNWVRFKTPLLRMFT